MQTLTSLGVRNTYTQLNRYGANHSDIMRALVKAEQTGIARIGTICLIHVGYEANTDIYDSTTSLYDIRL